MYEREDKGLSICLVSLRREGTRFAYRSDLEKGTFFADDGPESAAAFTAGVDLAGADLTGTARACEAGVGFAAACVEFIDRLNAARAAAPAAEV